MSTETLEQKQERAKKIIGILSAEYPGAKCTLDFETPHQLLVAAILAAQCTDEKVNHVTPELFKKYPTVQSFADADPEELQEMLKPTGFFRNKTKAVMQSAREIMTEFGGEVPHTIDELVSLSGVGRKTANLLMGVVYGEPAIIVDTHVTRVSQRLGLTEQKDATKIEFELRDVISVESWTKFNHLIVAHGRAVCKAPTPLCEVCKLLELCPYGQKRMAAKQK